MARGEYDFEAGDMVQFAQVFPGIARDETKCVVNRDNHLLPKGNLFFLESYCASPKCDCRRVFLNVRHEGMILATIGFGWAGESHYRRWYAGGTAKTTDADTEEIIRDLKGPVLEVGGYSSEYSDALLEYFRSVLANDEAFVRQLRSHYSMFKFKLKKMKHAGTRAPPSEPKIGRNEPCPCGSGKKFKKCCMKV